MPKVSAWMRQDENADAERGSRVKQYLGFS